MFPYVTAANCGAGILKDVEGLPSFAILIAMIIICIDTLDLLISFFLRVPDSHFFLTAFHETVNPLNVKSSWLLVII